MALPEVTQTSPGDRTAWAVLACPSAGCPDVMPAARSRFRLAIPAPVLLGPADGATQSRPSVEMRWEPIPSPTAIDLLPFYIAYRLEWTRTPGDYSASDLYQGSPGASTFFTVDAIKSDVTLAWRDPSRHRARVRRDARECLDAVAKHRPRRADRSPWSARRPGS